MANQDSMSNPWREEHDQPFQNTNFQAQKDHQRIYTSQAPPSYPYSNAVDEEFICPVNNVLEQLTSPGAFDTNVIQSNLSDAVGQTAEPDRPLQYTNNQTNLGYQIGEGLSQVMDRYTNQTTVGYYQMGQSTIPPALYDENAPKPPNPPFQPSYDQSEETQSALFQQLQNILTDQRFRGQHDHVQQTSDPPYDPSMITPGAPSLPSARHRISTIPYHLSPDHHSAKQDLRSTDNHSSRKRPQSFEDDDEQEQKRWCGVSNDYSLSPRESYTQTEGTRSPATISHPQTIHPLKISSSRSGRSLEKSRLPPQSQSPPIASTSRARVIHSRPSRTPPIASTSQARVIHSRRSRSPPIASTSRATLPLHPGHPSDTQRTGRSAAPHHNLPTRNRGDYGLTSSRGSSRMSIDSSVESNLRLLAQKRGSSRMSLDTAPPSRQVARSPLQFPAEPEREQSQADILADVEDSEPADSESADSESDGVFDLAEKQKYKKRGAQSRTQRTKERQEGARLAKLSKNPSECSPHEPLTRAIQDYVKLLLGIPRKRKGRKANYTLPPPPSDNEYQDWGQRKFAKQELIRRAISDSRQRYLRKQPLATSSQLAIVEKLAAEKALSNVRPTQFVSRTIPQNGQTAYSISVAYTCERVLALAGFPRLAYDWLNSAKSSWNESVLAILSEEWEKCHRRGAADDYDIDINLVTSKNIRQILERWFTTKSREYNSKDGSVDPEVAKEKLRQKASQKRVCEIRQEVLATHFKELRELRNILSHKSAHSEDEVDSDGVLYRIPKLWRAQDLDMLLHLMDELHIKTRLNDQAKTTATKCLQRGEYAEPGEAELLSRPPSGFPRSLLDDDFMNRHVTRAEVAALKLSAKAFDLTPLIAHIRWLLSPEGGP